MTGEEMERAIEFILRRQATLEERIEQTQGLIAETNRIVQMQANSQSQFNETVTTAITALAGSQQKLTESQQKLTESQQKLTESQQELAESQQELAESQQELAESQRELAESQRELADSIQHTDRKLDALIDIVRERLEGKDGSS